MILGWILLGLAALWALGLLLHALLQRPVRCSKCGEALDYGGFCRQCGRRGL